MSHAATYTSTRHLAAHLLDAHGLDIGPGTGIALDELAAEHAAMHSDNPPAMVDGSPLPIRHPHDHGTDELRPWPGVGVFDGGEPCCPDCGHFGCLQVAEKTTRYWRGFGVSEAGTVFAYDDTTYDEGDDPRIECIVCQATWALPEDVEYG